MEEGVYHFDGVHAVAVTEGGEYVTLYVTGASGPVGLRLAAKELPWIISKLAAAGAEAKRVSGDQTLRSRSIHEIRVIDSLSDRERSILSVAFEPGGLPLAMDLPRSGLIDFARSILKTAGELASEKPSTIQ